MRGIPHFITYLELLKKIEKKVDKAEYQKLIIKLQKGLNDDGNFHI